MTNANQLVRQSASPPDELPSPEVHSRRARALAALFMALVSLAACADGAFLPVPPSQCKSGLQWAGGDSESPEMRPGRDCITCHEDEGGPVLTVAGTVYDELTAHDDCTGVEGAEVLLVDAEGTEFTLTTGLSGNFHLTDALVFPLHAAVRRGDKLAEMSDPVPHGSCNDCHRRMIDLDQDRPGRILAP